MLLSISLIILLSPYSWALSVSSLPPSSLASLASITSPSTAGKAHHAMRTMINCTIKGGECDESKSRVVCGTDNQTYPTRCHLIRAQCAGRKVSLKHRGPCKEYYSYTECLESRTYAIAHPSSSPKRFVPRCRSDGTYAAVQCMGGSGCWCSDGQGKPIPNTTTTHGKPICPKISKVNIRRSPPSRSSRVRKRICRRNDHRTFSNNLLNVFYNEYRRTHPLEKTITDKTVADWKFNQLDTNKDDKIHKLEFKELRRIVRQVVKPKRCARLFGKLPTCDIDTYGKLSRQDWLNCLNKERFIPLNTPSIRFEDDDDVHSEDDDYDNEDEQERSDDKRSFPFFTPVTPYLKTIVETDSMLRESDTEWDCLADRAAALDEQKQNGAVYVPECTPDGRYERTQCYRSVGYCWCVNEDTGKNIPGTSVKDGRPDCATNSTRPMKGCPEPRKLEFLKELKEYLRTRIVDTRSGANVTNWSSEEEKVATLSFILIDKNKNGFWERKEWKTFRELVTAASVLKNCGKKMPRYCDVNSDKKITLSEWLGCLQVQAVPYKPKPKETPQERPTQSALKLKGPNPLESYLKSD